MSPSETDLVRMLSEGPVGIETIATELATSRSCVREQLDTLASQGYELTQEQDRYRLVGVPFDRLEALPWSAPPHLTVELHDSLASTNARARRLGEKGELPAVVVGKRQTEGRGRRDRAWASPPGGLYLSLAWAPKLPADHLGVLTLAAGVEVHRALFERDVPAAIKWPNDVHLEGDEEAKLAGILAETHRGSTGERWTVVGIGINANTDPADLPTRGESVRSIRGSPIDRRTLATELIQGLLTEVFDREAIRAAWIDRSSTLGRTVSIETTDDRMVGRAKSIDDTGALLVETETGRQRIAVGDCRYLRSTQSSTERDDP